MNFAEIQVVGSLQTEPTVLEGVASAYCYKLELLNPELKGKTFKISDENDVFSFKAVNKKRALKKDNWPIVLENSSANSSSHVCEISAKMMAGKSEIKHCNCCPQWKDKTLQPLLMITPTGARFLQFTKVPLFLFIFR